MTDIDQAKKKNMLRMMTMMISGMAKTLYDLFGETAYATMGEVGKDILAIMEKEMGLEIAGEDPKVLLMEIGRIFTDEIGFIASYKVEEDGNALKLIVDRCQGWPLTQKIMEAGVDTPFTCPIMNVGQAALARIGKPASRTIDPVPETRGSVITFRFVE